MWRLALAACVVALLCVSCGLPRENVIVVGSKNFSESALLGEILAQHLEAKLHRSVDRRFYLAGTFICQQALLAGRIDTYVEYTGTALTAVLKDPSESDSAAVFQRVRDEYRQRFDLDVFPSLGFNNTFAIVVRGDDARKFNLKKLSDLSAVAPQWRPGFGYEFMERPDGYLGLRAKYGLNFDTAPRVLDLGLLYRALLDGQVDVVAGNSTDGILSAHDLVILEDDKHYFPAYDAVPVVRPDTLERFPGAREALLALANTLSDSEMRKMNFEVDVNHRDIADVAREFLRSKGLD
ncbi:MAG: glycine betaine ABC transporter substrate-binding protein [Candidatus Acidiferrales bacterium]